MFRRAVVPAVLVLLLTAASFDTVEIVEQGTRGFDPLRDSLARDEPQAIYAPDPDDPWNELFYLLYTRSVTARVIADPPPFSLGGNGVDPASPRITRIESGDRAIDPLYPSWLWKDSSHFDFEREHSWRFLQDPRYSRLVAALEHVRRTADGRPALARALMQADVWSLYDMLHQMTATPRLPSGDARDEAVRRARSLRPLVASTVRALALSSEEIARLPDNYSRAAATHRLPDLLGEPSDWMEIRWVSGRSHDHAAGYRRATRVFVRPSHPPDDVLAFLSRLREQRDDGSGALDSVALLIQLLLVTPDGVVVPSSITQQVQFRGIAARRGAADIPQYELSRRQLLASPQGGGLVGVDAHAPAYLPVAGNDFAFATAPTRTTEPVLAPLGARCAACHGAGPAVRLRTLDMHPPRPSPSVVRLAPAENLHVHDVARLKMKQADFVALRQQWHELDRVQ